MNHSVLVPFFDTLFMLLIDIVNKTKKNRNGNDTRTHMSHAQGFWFFLVDLISFQIEPKNDNNNNNNKVPTSPSALLHLLPSLNDHRHQRKKSTKQNKLSSQLARKIHNHKYKVSFWNGGMTTFTKSDIFGFL